MNPKFGLLSFCRFRDFWTTLCRVTLVLLLVISFGLGGCQARPVVDPSPIPPIKPIAAANLTEVSPPPAILELGQWLDRYQPLVHVLTPTPNQVLADTELSVTLSVENLPIFADPKTGLGPYVQISVDNQAPQTAHNLDQPIVFKDLSPGTHTLRVIALTPWGESFKTAGAYSQTQFHVLTRSEDHAPRSNLPTLTAIQTPSMFAAEPFLLDFYLYNAPLHHVVTQARDAGTDWRVKATINGTTFTVDRWESFYLTGLRPGKNWIRLELLDGSGQPIENGLNPVTWAVDYQPNGQDARSRLFRGELSAKSVQGSLSPKLESSLPPIPQPEPLTPPEPNVIETPEPATPAPIENDSVVEIETDLIEIIEIPEATEPETTAETPNSVTPGPKPQRSWRNLFTKEAKPPESVPPGPELPASAPEPFTNPEIERVESEAEIEIIDLEPISEPTPTPAKPQRSWRDLFSKTTQATPPETTTKELDDLDRGLEKLEVAEEPEQSEALEVQTPENLTPSDPVTNGNTETSSPPLMKSWRDYFSESEPLPLPSPLPSPEVTAFPDSEAKITTQDQSKIEAETSPPDQLTPGNRPSPSLSADWADILAPVSIPKPQTSPPVIQAQPNAIQLPDRYRQRGSDVSTKMEK